MKVIGNIIWMLFGGLESAIVLFFYGIVACITIIGIPFGKQAFKMAKLIIAPFGKTVETHFGSHPILNILWMLWGGLESCICFYWIGILYCISIIGIPFGKQWFKMGKLVLFPFGANIVSAADKKAAEEAAKAAEAAAAVAAEAAETVAETVETATDAQ